MDRITQIEGGQTGLDKLDNKQMDRHITGTIIVWNYIT
jgi:hypothetical protein